MDVKNVIACQLIFLLYATMLRRCKERLVIVGCLAMAAEHPDSLIGKVALWCVEHGLVLPAGEAN